MERINKCIFKYYNICLILIFFCTRFQWGQTKPSELALMDVQHDASGQYACTVTLESPIYSKTSEYHDLTVISKHISCQTKKIIEIQYVCYWKHYLYVFFFQKFKISILRLKSSKKYSAWEICWKPRAHQDLRNLCPKSHGQSMDEG